MMKQKEKMIAGLSYNPSDAELLYDRINVSLDKRTVSKKAKRLLLELYRELPKDGRIGYDSENMDNVRKKVDDVTDYFLMRNIW